MLLRVVVSGLQVATTPSLVTSSTATTLTVNPVLPLTSAAVTNLSVTGERQPGVPLVGAGQAPGGVPENPPLSREAKL